MNRSIFSIISIINSFLISIVGIRFFEDYFIMYEDIPNGVDNAAGVGLAGIALGVLFLIANIIFVICIFTKASNKEIKKIYLNELLINGKDSLLKNIVRVITYLLIIFFIILSVREKYNVNSTFCYFYILSTISITIYSVWINNILGKDNKA